MKRKQAKMKRTKYLNLLGKVPRPVLIGLFVTVFAATGTYAIVQSSADSQITYYVSNSGNDANDGSQAAPFASLNKAVSMTSGGETIVVSSGTYDGFSDAKERTGMVTIKGVGASKPILEPTATTAHRGNQAVYLTGKSTYLRFENLRFAGGVIMGGGSNFEFIGNEVAGYYTYKDTVYQARIYPSYGTSNVLIENNDMHNTIDAITIYGTGTQGQPNRNITIRNNHIHEIENGIRIDDVEDLVIDHNDIHDAYSPTGNHEDGIQFQGNTNRVSITNNRIGRSDAQGMLIQSSDGPNNNVLVQNNVIYNNKGNCIQYGGNERFGSDNVRFINNTLLGCSFVVRGIPTNTVVVNNILSSLSFYQLKNPIFHDYNLITSFKSVASTVPATFSPNERQVPDLGFVNAAAGDYRLSPTSPAIDMGTSDYSTPATDIDYNPRRDVLSIINTGSGTTKYYDVGAFEYQPSGSEVVDTLAPADVVPIFGTGSTGAPTIKTATITWQASTDNSATGVIGYKVYRNGSLVATVNSLSYLDSGLQPNTKYRYKVVAYDAAGNTSKQAIEKTISTSAKVGDLDGDNQVGARDLSLFLTNYSKSYPRGGFDGEPVASAHNLSLLLGNYGK